LFVIHELILLSVANFLNTAGKAQWFRYFSLSGPLAIFFYALFRLIPNPWERYMDFFFNNAFLGEGVHVRAGRWGRNVFLSNTSKGKPDCRDDVGHAHHFCQTVRIGMTYSHGH
ncbi:MAG TPA: hypothetical protein PKH14_13110, partial [Syntrophorhabdus sp.]|nr:hypothetical protein [Syntrophorhabdus sp.]